MNDQYDSRPETLAHMERVKELLYAAGAEIARRGSVHDQSKLSDAERFLFDEYTPKLKSCVYGSDEYKGFLAGLKPALDHHYAANSHHPEHYPNGVDGMDLFDLIEMFFDWKAATELMSSGNIYRSIEINTERFKLAPQVAAILTNTAERLGYQRP